MFLKVFSFFLFQTFEPEFTSDFTIIRFSLKIEMLSRQNVPINFRQIQGTILFRSSRPCGADLGTTFCSLGIKSVCDLRSEIEVDDDTGLDNKFSSFCLGLDGKGGITESQVRPKCPDSISKDSCEREGRHLFISLISTGRIFFRAPWHIKIRLVFAFLWDSLFGTKHTFRILLSKFIGGQGDHCLLFLYKIIVEDSGSQICASKCSVVFFYNFRF